MCMAKSHKLLMRLLGRPKDFTFRELQALLQGLGFVFLTSKGTGGSAVRFVIDELKKGGYLDEL